MRLKIRLNGRLAAACECVGLVVAPVSGASEKRSPRPSTSDVEKVRWTQECDLTGPYSGENFGMSDLVGGLLKVGVEHTGPRRRSVGDSWVRKTLCVSCANREERRKRTPLVDFGLHAYPPPPIPASAGRLVRPRSHSPPAPLDLPIGIHQVAPADVYGRPRGLVGLFFLLQDEADGDRGEPPAGPWVAPGVAAHPRASRRRPGRGRSHRNSRRLGGAIRPGKNASEKAYTAGDGGFRRSDPAEYAARACGPGRAYAETEGA